jgi:Rrf2 family protein
MISKKSIYAFKALIFLAGAPSGQPVLIADLAKGANVPRKFLEFILLSLRKGGLLQSRVGKGGGYTLALPASRITVGSIVRILEGDLAPTQCLSTTNYARCGECLDDATCGVRLTLSDMNEAIANVMDKLTLADMIERSEAARHKLGNIMDFSI